MPENQTSPIYDATDTYLDTPERDILNVSTVENIRILRRILPGPLNERLVVGAANITIGNVTLLLFRELAQRWNFSREEGNTEYSLSFIVPSVTDVTLDQGGCVDVD